MTNKELETLRFLARNLRFIRRSLIRVSVSVVSRNTGISRDVINRLEYWADKIPNSKMAFPSISTLVKLGEAYGVSVGVLFDVDISQSESLQEAISKHCVQSWNYVADGLDFSGKSSK